MARAIPRFESRSLFTTWLHVVVANNARQTYRTLKRHAAEEPHAVLPADRPDLVAPLVLRDVCQLDYREIATHPNIPEGTMKSRIHQARSDVRALLCQ